MAELYEVRDERASGLQENVEEERGILLERVRALAEELAHRPNLGLQTAPKREIERCAEIGVLTAPLPVRYGAWGSGRSRARRCA